MKLTEFLENIGRPVAYYPSLVKLTGSVTSVIFLCQLLYWRGKQSDPEGWIYKTQAEIAEETGLTRYEQETARKILKEKGLLIEKFADVPRKLYFLPCIDRINDLWLKMRNSSVAEDGEEEKSLEYPYNEENSGEGNEKTLKNQHNAGKPHYIMLETSIIECGKTTCNNVENQQANTENTTDNITKNIKYSLSDGERVSSSAVASKEPTKPHSQRDDSNSPSLFDFLSAEKSKKGKFDGKPKPGSSGERLPSKPKELLLYFAREYESYFGNPYNINWGKEMKLFSSLLRYYDQETIKKAIRWYFQMRDNFFYSNGYSVGVFYQKFNAILLSGKNSISEIIDRVFEKQEGRSTQCNQELVL